MASCVTPKAYLCRKKPRQQTCRWGFCRTGFKSKVKTPCRQESNKKRRWRHGLRRSLLIKTRPLSDAHGPKVRQQSVVDGFLESSGENLGRRQQTLCAGVRHSRDAAVHTVGTRRRWGDTGRALKACGLRLEEHDLQLLEQELDSGRASRGLAALWTCVFVAAVIEDTSKGDEETPLQSEQRGGKAASSTLTAGRAYSVVRAD